MNDQPYNVFAFCKALPRSILSHGAQRLLYLMATMWADRAGVCYPSESLLARESGYTPRHVRRLVTEAANAGWLMVQQGGGRVSNLYALMVGDMALEQDRYVHAQTFSGHGCPSTLDTGVHLTSHITAQGRAHPKNKHLASTQEIDSQESYYAREAVSPAEDLPCVRAEGFVFEQQEQDQASAQAQAPQEQPQDLAAQLLDLQALFAAKRPAYLAAKQAAQEQEARRQAEQKQAEQAQEAAQDLGALQDLAPLEESKGGGLEGVESGREILRNPSPCDLPEQGASASQEGTSKHQDLAALQTNTLRGALGLAAGAGGLGGAAGGGGAGGLGVDGAQTALGGAVGSFRASDGRGVGSVAAGASAGLVGAVLGGGGSGEVDGGEEMSEQERAALLRRAWGKMLRDVFGLDVEALRASGRGLPESRKVGREALAGLSLAQSLTVIAGVYEIMGREGVIGSLPRVVGMLRGKVEARALVVREWSPHECRLLLGGCGWRAAMEAGERLEAAMEARPAQGSGPAAGCGSGPAAGQGGGMVQEMRGVQDVRPVPDRSALVAVPAAVPPSVGGGLTAGASTAGAAALVRGGVAGYKALLASMCAPRD